ncbi:dynamin-binding protein isoform X2 [Anabrus simplex]|uniref:dynamin-binding protein isoform X2 n=1 Tax=Anabrus simplex TaxID=316456 RepID=UPI0035A2E3EA
MSEGDVARVYQDFLTTNEGELCLRKGDIVQIKGKIDRHWCDGCSYGKFGRVPLSYLIVLDLPALEDDQKLFVAIADFLGEQPGDLSFAKGELIVGIKQVDENWWQGMIEERIGIFPTTYIWELDSTSLKTSSPASVKNFKVQVKMDMKAQLDEEMDLHKGEIILVTEVIDRDWYRGVCGNRTGIFPSAYVSAVEELDDMSVPDTSNESHLHNISITDDDDYFKVNMPSVFQSGESVENVRSSSYFDDSSSTKPNFGIEADNQVPLVNLNNCTDDLSILEDDYFKRNMPSMFQSEHSTQNIQSSSPSDMFNHKKVYLEYQAPMELDIIPYGITLYPFYAQFDNELSFHEGEIVTLIRHVNKEWVEGKIDGRKGIFPSSYINIIVDCNIDFAPMTENVHHSFRGDDPSNKVENNLIPDSFAVVLYNFDAQMNGDITVKDGEVVYILKQINEDWCEVKNHTGNAGLCPRNYLAPYTLPGKSKHISHQRYSLANDSSMRDSEDNIISPINTISEMNKRNYLPDDFLQPKTKAQNKGSLDDMISKNLDSLTFTTSWTPRKASQRTNSAENLSSVHKLDIINDEKERNLVSEVPNKEYISDVKKEVIESQQEEIAVEQQTETSTVPAVRDQSPVPPFKRQMSDRMPHRPAPPIPLPGQQPVRRSIKLSHHRSAVRSVASRGQNVHQMKNIITAKESQLKYLKHIKEQTLMKLESQDESATAVSNEEAVEDMKYKVRACDEKIKFVTGELERLKGSIDDEDKAASSELEECEFQNEPSDGDVTVSGEESEEERRKKIREQRQNVISELVFTEKEYVRDLKLTYETFNLHNPEFLGSRGIDIKVIFGNIEEVMHLAEDFLDLLYRSMKGKDEEDQCIGPCFLEVADSMKSVYGEYCMNHDNALFFLEKNESNEDIKRIFDKGLETLRYQIACFDMGSILIKPVQRILKYPLILNELIKCTEETHKDKPELLKAVRTIMDVATYINEYKRRKDIVSKYLEDGNATISSKMSRLSLHSVAKKSNRLGALFTSSLGFGAVTKDSVFQEYETMFHAIEKSVRIFLKNVEMFIQYMREVIQCQWFIAEDIAHFYQEKNSEVEEFVKIQKLIDKKFWKDFENTVHRRVTTPLNTLIELFEGPLILIQKRQDKFLDYNACCMKAEKNRDVRLVKEELLAARNNYEALNNHLLEELPTLLLLSSELFVECLLAFVTARKLLTGKITKQYLALLEQSSKKSPAGDPLEVFAVKHNLVLNQLSRLSFLSKNLKCEQLNKRLSKNSPTLMERQASSENINQVKSSQTSSQRAYLQSRYPPNMIYHVTKPCLQNEPLDLVLNPGHLVAVIKKQNPMGNPSIWFVDDGATQGFVSSSSLEPFHSVPPEESSIHSTQPGTSSPSMSGRSSLSSQHTSRSCSEVSLPTFDEAVASSHFYHYIDEPAETHEQKNIYDEVKNEEPKSPVYAEVSEEPAKEFYYALYNFEGNGTQTLTMKNGQVVRVLQQHDLQNNSEWWFVEDRFGRQGYVPGNFLKRYNN